jgi:hypothetical protein
MTAESDAAAEHVRSYASEAQEALMTEAVDAILRDVFQGRRDNLRAHMLNVAGKVCRRHPWPHFEEVVEREVRHRLAGGEPRNHLAAAVARVTSPGKPDETGGAS